jgi:PiT family inorganic phosphate transporter
VVSGAITGAGAAKRFSAVRWGVAGNIVMAWMVTVPAAGLFGALVYDLSGMFGAGVTGPLVISGALLALLALAVVRRAHQTAPAPAAS